MATEDQASYPTLEAAELPTPPATPSIEVENTEEPLRVLAFDTQSTCSLLFSKSLSQHLRLGQIHHPYVLAATLGKDRIHTKIGNERTRELWDGRAERASPRVKQITYEAATNDLLRNADQMEKAGKTVFIKEYPPFVMNHAIMSSALQSHETIVSRLVNPTVIPDDLLRLFTPLIFIQHPALTLPDWMRLAKAEYGSYTVIDDDDFSLWTSLRWSRMLFDYLRSTQHMRQRADSAHSNRSSGKWEPGYVATRPYVIDAADVLCNNNAMLAAVCRLLGIDYQDISNSWTQYFAKAAAPLRKAMPAAFAKATMAFSERILGTAAININLDAETRSWEREFGKEVAQVLRKKVDGEMPHYLYLRNFKVQVLPSLTTAALQQNITGIPYRRASAVTNVDSAEFGHPLRIIRSALDVNPDRRKSALN